MEISSEKVGINREKLLISEEVLSTMANDNMLREVRKKLLKAQTNSLFGEIYGVT